MEITGRISYFYLQKINMRLGIPYGNDGFSLEQGFKGERGVSFDDFHDFFIAVLDRKRCFCSVDVIGFSFAERRKLQGIIGTDGLLVFISWR